MYICAHIHKEKNFKDIDWRLSLTSGVTGNLEGLWEDDLQVGVRECLSQEETTEQTANSNSWTNDS